MSEHARMTADGAARRYAVDAEFAAEFDRALSSLVGEQVSRLEVLAKRARVERQCRTVPLPEHDSAHESRWWRVPLEAGRILRTLETSYGKAGMTISRLARLLGVSEHDAHLHAGLDLLLEHGSVERSQSDGSERYVLRGRPNGS